MIKKIHIVSNYGETNGINEWSVKNQELGTNQIRFPTQKQSQN